MPPRKSKRPTAGRRESTPRPSSGSKAAGRRIPPSKPHRARRRAAARTLRKTGEFVLKPRLALALAVALFVAGALFGGGAGVYLQQSGLFGGPPAAVVQRPAEAPPAPVPEPDPEPRYLSSLRAVEQVSGAHPAQDPLPDLGDSVVTRSAPELPAEIASPERPGPRMTQAAVAPAWRVLEPELADSAAAAAGAVHTVYEEPLLLAHIVSSLEGSRVTPPAPAAEPMTAASTDAVLDTSPAGRPAWQENAVQVSALSGRPMIALVIDDLGLNRPQSWRAIELPAPLTLAFMTYAENIGSMIDRARLAGHELMLHVPMQPEDEHEDPGPNVLLVGHDSQELQRRLDWGLGRFQGIVGINNHMGSAFTAWRPGMRLVMSEVQRRGLLYLDSVTSERSLGGKIARELGVPYAERDVFLDNDYENRGSIRRQLSKLESVALRRGHAVGIAHPHMLTLQVLSHWLPEAQERGFALVPISAVARRHVELAAGGNSPGR